MARVRLVTSKFATKRQPATRTQLELHRNSLKAVRCAKAVQECEKQDERRQASAGQSLFQMAALLARENHMHPWRSAREAQAAASCGKSGDVDGSSMKNAGRAIVASPHGRAVIALPPSFNDLQGTAANLDDFTPGPRFRIRRKTTVSLKDHRLPLRAASLKVLRLDLSPGLELSTKMKEHLLANDCAVVPETSDAAIVGLTSSTHVNRRPIAENDVPIAEKDCGGDQRCNSGVCSTSLETQVPNSSLAATASAATNQRSLAPQPLPSSESLAARRSRSRLSPRKERNRSARRQNVFISPCEDNFLSASDTRKQNRFLEELRRTGLPVDKSEKLGFSALVTLCVR